MESNSVQNGGVRGRLRRFWSGKKRIRLLLTLELAVMLPAAALILLNFEQLKDIERDKALEAAIHRDFQQMLGYSEKTINQKAYKLVEETRDCFPSPAESQPDVQRKLEAILSERPWLAHVFLFDSEKGYQFRSQPQRMGEPDFLKEHQRIGKAFLGWFTVEGKGMVEGINQEAPAHHVVPGTRKTRRRPCVLHDGLLRVAAGVEGTRRDRRDGLRARLPEARRSFRRCSRS